MNVKLLFLILIICSCTSYEENKRPKKEEVKTSNLSRDKKVRVYSFDGYSLSEVSFQKREVISVSDDIFIEYISIIEVDDFGNIFVAESTPRSKSIYMFDEKGVLIKKIGKEGRGPGEFLMISDMKVKDDKLYVLDHKSYRISIYSLPSFELLRTITIRSQHSEKVKQYLLGDSFFILSENVFLINFKDPRSLNRGGSNFSGYFQVNNKGEIVSDTVITYRQPKYFVSDKEPGPGYVLPFTAPYSPSSLTGVSEKGTIYTIWTDSFLVKTYDRNGEYLNAYQYPFDRSELSNSEAVSVIAGDERKEIAKKEMLPTTWPAIHDMIIDDKDRLWVFTITDSDSSYGGWVLNKNGKPLGFFSWPGVRNNRHINTLGKIVIKHGFVYEVERKANTDNQQILKHEIEFTER